MAHEPGEQIDHPAATRWREPTQHAEIDQRDAVAGQAHHVAGMRIGLKEAVHQDHLEHGIHAACGDGLAIEARVVDGRQIVAADALDVLLHIHRAARPFPEYAWDEHVEIAGKVAGEAFRVAYLHCEIKLALERAAQLAYDVDRPVPPHLGYLLHGETGKMFEDPQVGGDLWRDSGAANLQDYRRAAGKGGPVYLRDRGGGVGFALKIGKPLNRRPTERLFDLRQKIVERHRRHLAVQPVELIGPRRRQKVLSCREHLAQLDEGGPEFLQGELGALLRLEMRDFTGPSPLQYLAGALEQRRDAGATHEVAEAMANEDRADLPQAGQLAGRTEHLGDHVWCYWNLGSVLRLGLVPQGIRDAGQRAAGKQCHSDACIADFCHPGCGTHASGKLLHHACDAGTRLHSEVLGVDRKLRYFATEVAGHRLRDAARRSRVVLFQLPQADQRFLQVVVAEVLPPCREVLESVVRRVGGLHKRLVKFPHGISE